MSYTQTIQRTIYTYSDLLTNEDIKQKVISNFDTSIDIQYLSQELRESYDAFKRALPYAPEEILGDTYKWQIASQLCRYGLN